MKRAVILCTINIYFLTMLFGSSVLAQSIKGRVIDSQYQPIPEVSILVNELGITAVTNNDGEFDISSTVLGLYTLSFQHPSYTQESRQIEMPSAGNVIQLVKKEQGNASITPPTGIGNTTENIAYSIMKRAIAMAPLYRNSIHSYRSQAYIKGSMRFIRISSFLRAAIDKESSDTPINEGDVFLQETINDITFEQNKYEQNSKLISNTFPKEFDLKIPLANYNIYDKDDNLISPLSDEAFDYYDFVYDGSFKEGDNTINQIKVLPKKNNERTLSGYLYISSNDWHVNRLELVNNSASLKTVFRQVYSKLDDKVWVITNGNFDFEISMLGNQIEASYVSEITYKNYILNQDVQSQLSSFNTSLLPVNKDLYKFGGASSSWKIPQSQLLMRSKKNTDKYVDKFEKIAANANVLKQRPLLLDILLGKTFNVDTTLSIRYGGLVNPAYVGYNLVDGWTYKQTLDVSKKIGHRYIQSGVTAQYSFDRKFFMFDADLRYLYLPDSNGFIAIRGGIYSADYNASTGMSRLENGISTLFMRQNFISFYENKYFNLSHTIDMSNKFSTSLEFSHHSRIQQNNISNYSVFYKEVRNFKPNIPVRSLFVKKMLNKQSFLLSDYKASIFTVILTYTPAKYYSKSNKRLYNSTSIYPDITFTWRKGLANIFNSTSDFDHLELAFNQYVRLGDLTSFQYLLVGGYFANNSNVHFSDFKHFNIKELDFMLTSFDQSYNLLNLYQPSTNQWYISSFNKYSNDRLFLKYLPIISRTSIKENLFLSYLVTPNLKNYAEMGYSLSNIGIFTSVGVFTGFQDFKYNAVGFKFSFNIVGSSN